ncbi:MAG: hypothetical protein WAL30_05475 [Candidatus Aquirickettsiella sp.]
MRKILNKVEVNTYEQTLYKASNLYLQHQKNPFNIFLFSKVGFYIGFLVGIILGVYITRVIAILISDFKLGMFKLVFVCLEVLIGVGVLIFLSSSFGSAIGWLLCKCLNIGRRINSKSKEKLKETMKNSKFKNLPLEIPTKKYKFNRTIKPYLTTERAKNIFPKFRMNIN